MEIRLSDIGPNTPAMDAGQVMDSLAADLLPLLTELEEAGREPSNLSEATVVLSLEPTHPSARFEGVTYVSADLTNRDWRKSGLRQWADVMAFASGRLGTWGQRPDQMKACVQACALGEVENADAAQALIEDDPAPSTPVVQPARQPAKPPLDVRIGTVLVRQNNWRWASWAVGGLAGLLLGSTVATWLLEQF